MGLFLLGRAYATLFPMKIVLATGIYPPAIGGPATYVHHIAEEFSELKYDVKVITFAPEKNINDTQAAWEVIAVPLGLPILRWFAFAKELKKHASDADIVYAFSSVSAGIPLKLARLKTPKKVLRLGGDFFWERYTDFGGTKSLWEWYEKHSFFARFVMEWLLETFDHIIFSTQFQQDLYEKFYKKLPEHTVVENALPKHHQPPEQKPNTSGKFRLLFMGRFVGFKNLSALIEAMTKLPETTLTMVGDGPLKKKLMKQVEDLGLTSHVVFVTTAHGSERDRIFQSYDLLVLPSLTEISPNVALEARTAGLPVLLTKETGLSEELSSSMMLADLRTPEKIALTLEHAQARLLSSAMHPVTLHMREWDEVAIEHVDLFKTLNRV